MTMLYLFADWISLNDRPNALYLPSYYNLGETAVFICVTGFN